MIKDLIMYADGRHEETLPKNGTDYTLEELQEIVGGYIEIVPFGMNLLVVNEEGKLLGLPVNVGATSMMSGRDTIVGNALYCRKDRIR